MYSEKILLLSLMASLLLVLDLKLAYAATTVAPDAGTEAGAAADAATAAGAAATEAPGIDVGVADAATTAEGAAATAGGAAVPADAATAAPGGSDVTVGGGGAAVTEGAAVPAGATEGATGGQDAVTEAAGGATVGAGDDATAGVQGATQAAEGTVAPPAVDVVTSGKAQEEVVTTAAAAVAPPAVATTRPPPEATYTVTSINVEPYLMVGDNEGGYTGYVMDVLKKLEEVMNVEFKLTIVKDGKYGKKEGEDWTGMIGEVVRGEADLAAAPLTATVDREEVVDFTYPFMSYSAAAVLRKRPGYSHPLTASLENLVDEGYRFAVTKNSNIYKILQATSNPLYKRILESIESNDGLKDSNNEGVKQARWDDNYAFLMESPLADWISHQAPCNLVSIKTEIYKRKYAFAVKNLSELRDKFNAAIIELQDLNVLEELQDKWFKPNDCSGCRGMNCSFVNVMVIVSISVLYAFWA